MITILTGSASFEIHRALEKIVDAFDGDPERFDGASLSREQLPDILMGVTLFSPRRLVIVRRLGENKSLWTEFESWIPRVHDDIHLVLVEEALDKRTKTYKALKKDAAIHEYNVWGERDRTAAISWVLSEATARNMALSRPLAEVLVDRVGLDQWQLFHAIEKLSVLDEVTDEVVRDIVEARPTENVFELFNAALQGNYKRIHEMITTLSLTEEAYRVFGLIVSQAYQLSVLAHRPLDAPASEVAKAMGAHPFVVQKLSPVASRLGQSGVRRVVSILAQTDQAMKSSSTDPWLLVERACMHIAEMK